jgi:hypothetical protein
MWRQIAAQSEWLANDRLPLDATRTVNLGISARYRLQFHDRSVGQSEQEWGHGTYPESPRIN